jgi:two-component system KDP operon response regulator KdpE
MTGAMPLILLIEDEPQIRRFVRATLESQHYQVVEAVTGQEGLLHATTRSPDLIILDLGLPDIDGLDVTQRLREWTLIPILILSARGREQEKIAALDAGADDYLTKPFTTGELLARMRVAFRHQAHMLHASEPIFQVGELCIDLAQRRVTLREAEIHLTPIEYKLLTTLAKHAGRVLTHRQLLKEVWGPGYDDTHYLRVYMAQLRHKVEAEPARPRYLLTESGVGYRLAAE